MNDKVVNIIVLMALMSVIVLVIMLWKICGIPPFLKPIVNYFTQAVIQ